MKSLIIVVFFFGLPALATAYQYVRLRPHIVEGEPFSRFLDRWIPWRILRPDRYTEEGQRLLPRLWVSFVLQVAGIAIAVMLL